MKKIDGCVGRSDGEFDKGLSVISDSRKVVIRKSDNGSDRELECGIYIPESSEMNNRMAKGVITDVSEEASNEYGLLEGDQVLFDRLAVYYDTFPVCVVDFENIICKIEDETPLPLKDMLIVTEMKKKETSHGGIILSGDNPLEIPVGEVIKSNSSRVKVGEYVPLTTGPDTITVAGSKYRIYKEDMVIATLELTESEKEDYES